MELNGIPLHPLVVHAAVVFAPLAAVLGVAFALFRRWRGWLRGLVAFVAVVAAGAVYLAKITGEDLEKKLTESGVQNKWIAIHQDRAEILVIVTIALAIALLVAVASLPGRDQEKSTPAIFRFLVVIAVVGLSAATGAYAYLTGDAGATAVWNAGR